MYLYSLCIADLISNNSIGCNVCLTYGHDLMYNIHIDITNYRAFACVYS